MLENPKKFKNSPNLLLIFVKITKFLEFFKKITIKNYSFFELCLLGSKKKNCFLNRPIIWDISPLRYILYKFIEILYKILHIFYVNIKISLSKDLIGGGVSCSGESSVIDPGIFFKKFEKIFRSGAYRPYKL